MTPQQLAESMDSIVVGLLSDTGEPDNIEFQRNIYPIIAQAVSMDMNRIYSRAITLALYYGYACSRATNKALTGVFNLAAPSPLHYDMEVWAKLVIELEGYSEKYARVFPAKWLADERRDGWKSGAPSSLRDGMSLVIITDVDEVMTDGLTLRVFSEVVGLMNLFESGVILLSRKPLTDYPPMVYKDKIYDYSCLRVEAVAKLQDMLIKV